MKRVFVGLLLTLWVLAWAQGGQSAGTQPTDLSARIQSAYDALNAGRYDLAIQLFEDVVALDYENFEAHFGLGLADYRLGNLRDALFEFRQLTKLFPERYEGWYNLAVVHTRMGDWQEAAKAFAQALAVGLKLKLAPEDLKPAYLGLAAAYEALGNEKKAAEVLRQAAKLLPEDLEVALRLARALVRSGQGDEAIPYLYKVLARERQDPTATGLLADVYLSQGLPDRAIRELDRSLAAAKDARVKARLLHKKALVLEASGSPAEAVLKLLEESARLDPMRWSVFYDLGRVRFGLGAYGNALAAFQKAYALNPEASRVLLGLAASYDALGRHDKAYEMARQAVQLAGGDVGEEALFLLGKSAYFTGRYSEAVDALGRVVKARPKDARAWLWLGLARYALEDYGQAVTALENAYRLSPDPSTRLNLGAAYLAARRFAEAEQIFQAVVSQDPKNAEAWYNLGWALKALGRQAEARRAWKKALELGYEPARALVR